MNNKAILLNNMGVVYIHLGENMKAIDMLFESLAIRDSLGLQLSKANNILLLGKVYELESNYQRANELYIESLEIFHNYGDMKRVATALTFIGANLHAQGEYQKAIDYYNTSLHVAQESELPLELSENYKFLLFTYAALGNEDSIMKYLELYADEKHKLIFDIEAKAGIDSVDPETSTDVSDQKLNGSDNIINKSISLVWLFTGFIIMGLIVFIFTMFAVFLTWHRRKK